VAPGKAPTGVMSCTSSSMYIGGTVNVDSTVSLAVLLHMSVASPPSFLKVSSLGVTIDFW
jgi:hypothetical protein